jgi:NAD kinase
MANAGNTKREWAVIFCWFTGQGKITIEAVFQLYLSLEDYITKRKREDCLNEFNLEQRVKNMGMCINYVVEYFEKYLDPEKINSEKATQKRKADKLKKQLENCGYEIEVVAWVVSIYEQYGKRVDLAVKNFAKQDLTFLLNYKDEDFTEFAKELIQDNKKKMPYLEGQTKILAKLTRNFFRYKGGLFIDFDRYNRFGEGIINWLKDPYNSYSVNLAQFASDYASDFFDRHHEIEYNRDFGSFEVKRDYDI